MEITEKDLRADGFEQRWTDNGEVLLLDDDGDLREVLGDVIAEILHRRCLRASSFDDLVALGERAIRCDAAILDVNLGPDRPSGVDAYEWLERNGFRGRVAFLTGHARSHPAVQSALRVRRVRVYKKPISIEILRSFIEEAP